MNFTGQFQLYHRYIKNKTLFAHKNMQAVIEILFLLSKQSTV